MGRYKKNRDREKESFLQRPRLNLSPDTKRGVAVVVFVGLAVITALAAFDVAGSLGQKLMQGLAWGFGVLAYVVPLLLLLIAVLLYRQQLPENRQEGFYWRIYLGALLLTGAVAGIIHTFYIKNGESAFGLAQAGSGGGFLGAFFGGLAIKFLGFIAANVILFALFIIGVLVAFDVALHVLWPKKPAAAESSKPSSVQLPLTINTLASQGFVKEKVALANAKIQTGMEAEGSSPLKTTVSVNSLGKPSQIHLQAMTIKDRFKAWKLPPFDLLDSSDIAVDSGNIEANVAIIKKTLEDFGIEVEMGEVNVGPTVTQYTLRPAAGIRLSQIGALQDNLALALAAHSVRMELPIPGKPLVGLEVPNKSTAIVRIRDVMQTPQFVDHKSKLALALGRDVAGHAQAADLAKMPHLLIAGATGTGKSVCINSLFISLLYRNTPQDVKFIVIDPKRVELNLYNGIPHLLTPVVTDYEKAVNALKWSVAEMDRRYKLLSETDKRNIVEYNESHELRLPYVVIFVDELADLMAVAQADVEAAVVRLAQMARAVGIHLVVATQRPSVDIITGLIKANITSRIAFAVASQVDSRTILDSAGAEKLLGNGDMLYISSEFNKPRRIQGAFIGEKEVRRVVDFFRQQAGAPIYNEEILEKPKKSLGFGGFDYNGDDGEGDPLLEEAMEEVKRAGKASASLLQRRLRIGYARAARLLDILEAKGAIGPGEGAKPREVYGAISSEEKSEYGVEEIDQD